MKVRSPLLAVIIVAVFVSGIGLSMAFNLWRTEASKEPARYESGEFAGEYNPADIRGSYTFGDIEDTFGVPAQVLGKAFDKEVVFFIQCFTGQLFLGQPDEAFEQAGQFVEAVCGGGGQGTQI